MLQKVILTLTAIAGLVCGIDLVLVFPQTFFLQPIPPQVKQIPPQVQIPQSRSAGVPDPPPDHLMIKGEAWDVLPFAFKKHRDLYPKMVGLTECDKKFIWYDPDTNAEDLRDTLWHEIMHAGVCSRGKDDPRADSPIHASVYYIAAILTCFVHDNPEFMKWAENWQPRVNTTAKQ